MIMCTKCKVREIEVIDDWESDYCPSCNDRLAESYNKQREWDYYHPNTPCPKSER